MKFFKNNRGVHLMCTSNSEYTVCGTAWDGTEMFGNDEKEMTPIAGFNIITCKACKEEIKNVAEYLRARAGKIKVARQTKNNSRSPKRG
jgi:hypothetical protein